MPKGDKDKIDQISAEKTVVKVTKGQISDGPISKNLKYLMMYYSAKFHAFIIKGTIVAQICISMNTLWLLFQ